jgi:hypothetical protein
MTWPTGDEPTTALDSGTDTPPRAVFLSLVQKFNQLRAHVSTYMQDVLVAVDSAAARTALGLEQVVLQVGAQTIDGVKSFTSRLVAAGAYTPSLQPTHSATPTFDCALSNVFEPAALTANITSMTLSNPLGGQTVNIRFVQDATGGRTVALPSGAKAAGSVNPTANGVSWLTLTYSARASRWEGSWLQVPA